MKLLEIWDSESVFSRNFSELLKSFIKPKVILTLKTIIVGNSKNKIDCYRNKLGYGLTRYSQCVREEFKVNKHV
jgi:hypothetical protein